MHCPKATEQPEVRRKKDVLDEKQQEMKCQAVSVQRIGGGERTLLLDGDKAWSNDAYFSGTWCAGGIQRSCKSLFSSEMDRSIPLGECGGETEDTRRDLNGDDAWGVLGAGVCERDDETGAGVDVLVEWPDAGVYARTGAGVCAREEGGAGVWVRAEDGAGV